MVEELIVRKFLTNGSRGKKLINMPYVYQQIDRGRPLQEIAEELGVSRTTIYRRHNEYQEMVKAELAMKEATESLYDEGLLPLPEEI